MDLIAAWGRNKSNALLVTHVSENPPHWINSANTKARWETSTNLIFLRFCFVSIRSSESGDRLMPSQAQSLVIKFHSVKSRLQVDNIKQTEGGQVSTSGLAAGLCALSLLIQGWAIMQKKMKQTFHCLNVKVHHLLCFRSRLVRDDRGQVTLVNPAIFNFSKLLQDWESKAFWSLNKLIHHNSEENVPNKPATWPAVNLQLVKMQRKQCRQC